MAGISDFIQMATKQLGVSAGAAEAGAGGLLAMLKDKVGGDLFGKVAAAIPGAEAATAKAPAPGGGGLGGLLGKAKSMFGGAGGGAMDVAAMLGKAGIGLDKARGFGDLFLGFLRQHLPGDLLKTLLSKAGDLGKLFG